MKKKSGIKKDNNEISPALKQEFRNLEILLKDDSRKLSEIINLLKNI